MSSKYTTTSPQLKDAFPPAPSLGTGLICVPFTGYKNVLCMFTTEYVHYEMYSPQCTLSVFYKRSNGLKRPHFKNFYSKC